MKIFISIAISIFILTAFSINMVSKNTVPDNINISSIIKKTASFGVNKYPISFWNYTNLKEHSQHINEAAVAEWADAGFTVPQSPSYDPSDPVQKEQIIRILDSAQKYGMKLILCDPRCHAKRGINAGELIPSDYADGIKAAVKDFGDHPATFGFHVGDEPDADMKLSFFESYRIQKEIAPNLHPFANLLPYFPGIEVRAGTDKWANYLDEFVKKSNADLISYDCYAQMNPGEDGWNNYYENLRFYREASLRNGIPFWNTILSVGHFRYRCPNLDEIRWQFNTTVASGANGILWFFYYMRKPHDNYRLSPVDEHWEKTQTYYDIRRIQKNFHKHYGDLFNRIVSTRVTFYPKPFGGGKRFKLNGVISKIKPAKEDHPILIGEFVDLENKRYAMIVNNSMKESVNVAVTFPGKDVKVFSWDWYGSEYEGGAYCASGSPSRDDNGLTINHWLAPGQEAVYRVESESAAKESI